MKNYEYKSQGRSQDFSKRAGCLRFFEDKNSFFRKITK